VYWATCWERLANIYSCFHNQEPISSRVRRDDAITPVTFSWNLMTWSPENDRFPPGLFCKLLVSKISSSRLDVAICRKS